MLAFTHDTGHAYKRCRIPNIYSGPRNLDSERGRLEVVD